MAARRPKQLELPEPPTWGGKRARAGRKPGQGRRSTPHRSRPLHKAAHPVHLTLRARRGVPSLRAPGVFRVVRGSIARSSRDEFRIVHYSVQGDHVHLLVEAVDALALSAGARGLAIRTARLLNRALGRSGAVWGDRYHARALTSPRQVRHALVYVLMNVRKHQPGRWRGLDPCSSAVWFDGFSDWVGPPSPDPAPVRRARTWLARRGWRRYGLVSCREGPRQLI